MQGKKRAIIDLDGVVANSEARFERATAGDKINWQVAFEPAAVQMDTLIERAYERIFNLGEVQGYEIIYLTSRPMSMYAATWEWLRQHDLAGPKLICKPDVKKYTKTVAWKAEEVSELAEGYGTVIFVDDEPNNLQAVQELGLSNVACFTSLAEVFEEAGR